MKIPEVPPQLHDALEAADSDSLGKLVNPAIRACDDKGNYHHWEKLKHLEPPEGYTPELWWLATRVARDKISQAVPFTDKNGQSFKYSMAPSVIELALWISAQAAGAVAADPTITDPKTKRTHLISSLIEEAINSSQLEGAATTRAVAKEMIRTERRPTDKGEQMILNNYTAMKFIQEFIEYPLTPALVFQLHKILTEGTFDEGYENKAGVFRSKEDDICVEWEDGTTLHVPPPVCELENRLQAICDFANVSDEQEGEFIPPIIRAIVVHFMVGYDHPFFDGNGRTARALFYWVMAKSGFWLMEYVSISRVIKSAPNSYMKAYMHTETDGGDVTYFLIHQLIVVKKSIEDLHKHLIRKTEELNETEKVLHDSRLKGAFNHRQLALLKNAMKNPGAIYTFKSHQKSHGVTYQTARTDLLALADEYQLLEKERKGKADLFRAPRNLIETIQQMQ